MCEHVNLKVAYKKVVFICNLSSNVTNNVMYHSIECNKQGNLFSTISCLKVSDADLSFNLKFKDLFNLNGINPTQKLTNRQNDKQTRGQTDKMIKGQKERQTKTQSN